MTLQDGDILLVKVNHFSKWYRWLFAQLIRFFDGVYYHHAQIVCGGLLWEANTEVKAQELPYDKGDEVLVLRLKYPLSDVERGEFYEILKQTAGKKYDYWGAMLHQLVFILCLRRIWIGRRGNKADGKPYCTELVTSIMHKLRGYFPEHYKAGPSKLILQAPLYYDVVFEGVWMKD